MASFFFLDDHPARGGRKGGNASRQPSVAGQLARASLQEEWAPSSTLRTEVRPPSLFARSQPQWRNWVATAWNWLWDDADLQSHPRVLQGLVQVRGEFLSVVWDLQSYKATQVRESVTQARSLRELWHLRSDVFNVIAVHRGQIEAYRRLDSLNRHFPVRITLAVDASTAGRVSDW